MLKSLGPTVECNSFWCCHPPKPGKDEEYLLPTKSKTYCKRLSPRKQTKQTKQTCSSRVFMVFALLFWVLAVSKPQYKEILPTQSAAGVEPIFESFWQLQSLCINRSDVICNIHSNWYHIVMLPYFFVFVSLFGW